jgi:energy-coupling factor transporter ATP-binding protein EcfA2
MQIWIQLLWHFFRAKEVGTLVLDEPDVYLHPELQRRLVRLLESRPRQVILASHSAEILAEAPNDSVVWVDRRSIGARRTKTNQALSTLSSLLGSKFNLSIARGMRSKAVIATDFRDSRVFAALARTVGGERLASDAHVTHIALGDAIRRMNPAHLATNLREILPAGVKAFVILQRGYRSKTEINEICKEVSIPGVRLFVLARNELENYLLDADAIARVSGADVQSAAVKLAETLYSLRGRTRAHYVAARINSMPEGSNAPAIASATDAEFESSWNHSDFPVALTEGSIAIELLSQSLQRDGYRGIATTQLAKSLRPEGMAVDLFRTLIDISEMLN